MVRLELGSAVYDALAAMQMDLLVRTPGSDWTVRPGTLQTDRYFNLRADAPDMTVRFDIRTPATEFKATSGMTLKTPITELKVTAGAGDRYASLSDFTRPLQASLPVPSLASYRRDEIAVQTWAAPGIWTKQPSRLDYEAGRVLADHNPFVAFRTWHFSNFRVLPEKHEVGQAGEWCDFPGIRPGSGIRALRGYVHEADA